MGLLRPDVHLCLGGQDPASFSALPEFNFDYNEGRNSCPHKGQ